jgi:membrane protein DedA with SNARE-associated domain
LGRLARFRGVGSLCDHRHDTSTRPQYASCILFRCRFRLRRNPISHFLCAGHQFPDIKAAVFDRVRAFLHRFGSLSLSLAALLPPPFPTSAFAIGAGVTRYPSIAFVLSFGVGRACRFALLAYLASVFGGRFVTSIWSTHTLVLVAAFGGALMCIGLLAWLVFRKFEPDAPLGL